jgi:hypothetical protein
MVNVRLHVGGRVELVERPRTEERQCNVTFSNHDMQPRGHFLHGGMAIAGGKCLDPAATCVCELGIENGNFTTVYHRHCIAASESSSTTNRATMYSCIIINRKGAHLNTNEAFVFTASTASGPNMPRGHHTAVVPHTQEQVEPRNSVLQVQHRRGKVR